MPLQLTAMPTRLPTALTHLLADMATTLLDVFATPLPAALTAHLLEAMAPSTPLVRPRSEHPLRPRTPVPPQQPAPSQPPPRPPCNCPAPQRHHRTCWAIWLVQNQQALKAGGWYTHSAVTQQAISFEGLYNWLKAQHGKHENRNLYDQVTKKRLKQYKFPFKVFTVPPLSTNLFKYIKGARRLSDWVYGCQESMDAQDRPRSMGFPYGIIAQKPPELIAAPPLAEAAVARRQAVWERVRARAHRQSVGLRTAQDGSEDAEQTRELVDAIVEESGGAHDREAESTEGGGPSVSLNDIEHALMEDSEEEEEGDSGAGPSAAGGEGGGAGSSTEEPPPALPAQPPLHNTEGGEGFSAYELERRENIRRNELHLESLGLLQRVLPAPRPAPRPPPHVPEGPARSSQRVAKLATGQLYTHAECGSQTDASSVTRYCILDRLLLE